MQAFKPIALITLVLISFAFAAAQEQDSEKQAKREQAYAASRRGDAFFYEKKYEEAIRAYREAVDIWNELGGFNSRAHYHLARALTEAGHPAEALEEYRQAVLWDANRGELNCDLAVAMDYAMLLATQGKVEEAKAMYYYGLRIFNATYPHGMFEPVPFLVVFDPDSTMTVWPYTLEKFTLAATALKATMLYRNDPQPMRDVRKRAPDWIFPAMVLVWPPRVIDGGERERFAEAANLARTPEERKWVYEYRGVFDVEDSLELLYRWMSVEDQMASLGAARRKASVVLEQARQNLKNIHQRIAIEWRGK